MVVVTQTKSDYESLPTNDSSSNPTLAASSSSATVEKKLEGDSRLLVSEACFQRIQQLVAAKPEATLDSVYLRVFVDAGGCSGFSYKFEVSDDDLEEDDVVYTDPTSGARVVVDLGSLELIQGSTIDYVQEMIKSGFEVRDNPQSESACGCGSSFALKNFSANPAVD